MLVLTPEGLHAAIIHRGQGRATRDVGPFRQRELVRIQPVDEADRRSPVGCQVGGVAARGVNDQQIAADEVLVGHQPFDEGDSLAVGRPAWMRDLQLWLAQRAKPAIERQHEQARRPPALIAGAMRTDGSEGLAVRRPVVFVDVQVGGRDDLQLSAAGVDHRDALVLQVAVDDAGFPWRCAHRALGVSDSFEEQHRDSLAVARPGRRRESASHLRQLLWRSDAGHAHEELKLAFAAEIREKRQAFAVRRPGRIALVARLARSRGDTDRLALGLREVENADDALLRQPPFGSGDGLDPGELLPVGGELGALESDGLAKRVEGRRWRSGEQGAEGREEHHHDFQIRLHASCAKLDGPVMEA